LHWQYDVLPSLSLINIVGQERPVYDVTNQQILMAHYMASVNKTAFPGDITNYLSAVYWQESYDQSGNTTFTYYNSTLCQNVIPADDPRYNGLVDAFCPDMPAYSTFQVQVVGGLATSSALYGDTKQFKLVVGTCENF
jgi:hypothetical protein